MKNRRKLFPRLLVPVLVLALLFSLTACSTFETKVVRAARKATKLENQRVDWTVDLGIELGMLGQSMDMGMELDGTLDLQHDPTVGRGDFGLELSEGTMAEGLYYFALDDGAVRVYFSMDGGNSWTVQSYEVEMQTSSRSIFDVDRETLSLLRTIAATFEETGTETVEGSEAVVYSGFIRGTELKTVLDATQALESIAASLGTDPDALQIEEIGDIPVTLAIDQKSGMIVRVTMDLSGLMDSLWPFLMQVAMQTSGAQEDDSLGLGGVTQMMNLMKVSFSEFLITVELYDFNSVGSVVIPAEVIENAVEVSG